MQEQPDDRQVTDFTEAIKVLTCKVSQFFKRIKRVVDQAIAWFLDKLGKRTQDMTTSPMRRTLDAKWNKTWDKARMMHPHASPIVMKKRSRAHQDQRMMKRACSTLKS